MKSALLRLLMLISISTMVALAALGTYVVAMQSQIPNIVAPSRENWIHLPSQAPRPKPVRPYVEPGDNNPDWPSPH
jgi:hypothetical protein